MSTRRINVFISHAWSYSGHYETLSAWIFDHNWSYGQASLDLRDFSVPKNDPIHDASSLRELRQAIYNQIRFSHVIVIPTGMYASYSKWIKREIEGAKEYGKPILAVSPWAQERQAGVVVENADRSVGWNKKPLVQAIWDLYSA